MKTWHRRSMAHMLEAKRGLEERLAGLSAKLSTQDAAPEAPADFSERGRIQAEVAHLLV